MEARNSSFEKSNADKIQTEVKGNGKNPSVVITATLFQNQKAPIDAKRLDLLSKSCHEFSLKKSETTTVADNTVELRRIDKEIDALLKRRREIKNENDSITFKIDTELESLIINSLQNNNISQGGVSCEINRILKTITINIRFFDINPILILFNEHNQFAALVRIIKNQEDKTESIKMVFPLRYRDKLITSFTLNNNINEQMRPKNP